MLLECNLSMGLTRRPHHPIMKVEVIIGGVWTQNKKTGMNIRREERPFVKAECLRLLATLKLAPARMQLISGFVDTYLRLDDTEKQVFQ